MATRRDARGPARQAVVADDGPPRTRTLPEAQRGAWFDGLDIITQLRVWGTERAVELPRHTKTFTLGSSTDRDIVVAGEFVSALHCVLERRGASLRVHDQGSHNGTFFRGRRETSFELRPGDTFTAASVRLLALSDEMRAAYPTLVELLGSDAERDGASPGDLIVLATSGAHVLVTGDPGCDHERLARTLHALSLRRGRPLVELRELGEVPSDRPGQRALLDRAARTTLVLSSSSKAAPIDPAFTSMLFSPSYQIRVILLAPTLAKAAEVLGGTQQAPMHHVALRSLAERRDAILPILDRMFVERGGALRVASLTEPNRAALRAWRWPDNFAGLRLAADRLVALAQAGSLRRTADVLGIQPSSLHYWFTQLGLRLPLASG